MTFQCEFIVQTKMKELSLIVIILHSMILRGTADQQVRNSFAQLHLKLVSNSKNDVNILEIQCEFVTKRLL